MPGAVTRPERTAIFYCDIPPTTAATAIFPKGKQASQKQEPPPALYNFIAKEEDVKWWSGG